MTCELLGAEVGPGPLRVHRGNGRAGATPSVKALKDL